MTRAPSVLQTEFASVGDNRDNFGSEDYEWSDDQVKMYQFQANSPPDSALIRRAQHPHPYRSYSMEICSRAIVDT